MSSSFFISCLIPPQMDYLSDYRINVDDYVSKLRMDYPFAKIYRPQIMTKDTLMLLGWTLDDESRIGVEGHLHSDSITVSFSTRQYWNTKDYMLWHRQYVPENVPLYLFNQELDAIPLTYQTTKSELTLFTGISVG